MSTDEPRRETRDLDARLIACAALGLAAVLVASGFGLAGLQRWFQHADRTAAPVTGSPPIWVGERELKERYLADRSRELRRYRWIDRKGGVVQLPIDRAMALVAQRGIRWRLDEAPSGSLAHQFRGRSTELRSVPSVRKTSPVKGEAASVVASPISGEVPGRAEGAPR